MTILIPGQLMLRYTAAFSKHREGKGRFLLNRLPPNRKRSMFGRPKWIPAENLNGCWKASSNRCILCSHMVQVVHIGLNTSWVLHWKMSYGSISIMFPGLMSWLRMVLASFSGMVCPCTLTLKSVDLLVIFLRDHIRETCPKLTNDIMLPVRGTSRCALWNGWLVWSRQPLIYTKTLDLLVLV